MKINKTEVLKIFGKGFILGAGIDIMANLSYFLLYFLLPVNLVINSPINSLIDTLAYGLAGGVVLTIIKLFNVKLVK